MNPKQEVHIRCQIFKYYSFEGKENSIDLIFLSIKQIRDQLDQIVFYEFKD